MAEATNPAKSATWSAAATCASRPAEGLLAPVIQLVTAEGERSLSRRASSVRVIPSRSKWYSMRFPMVTPLLSAHLNDWCKPKLMATERRGRRRSTLVGSLRMKKMGSYRQVTEAWKALVREVLDARGRGSRNPPGGQTRVCVECDHAASGSGTSLETSRLAAAVAEETGVPLPDDLDESLSDVMYEVSRLSSQGKRTALQIVRTLRMAEEKSAKD